MEAMAKAYTFVSCFLSASCFVYCDIKYVNNSLGSLSKSWRKLEEIVSYC